MLIKGLLTVIALVWFSWPLSVLGADKLIGIHSARVMSQSLPWVAEEAGLFKKYNLDFHLVFISSSSILNTSPCIKQGSRRRLCRSMPHEEKSHALTFQPF